MAHQPRMLCDLCGAVKNPAHHPPPNVPRGRCPLCVRNHGWPDPVVLPFHRRPADERKRDPDVQRFYDELAAFRKRQAKREAERGGHVPTTSRFREFVL